jgi:hypothetical protein
VRGGSGQPRQEVLPPSIVLCALFLGKIPVLQAGIVASPSGMSVTSTVLDPGGTSSFPSHPHVNTTLRGGSSSTNSPTTTAWPICTR